MGSMRHRGQAASIVRRTLFEGAAIGISSFAAHPESDACGDVERQNRNVVVLPFSGVFAKHDAPGRHVVGTPSHAVFIASDTPYRVAFPGAVGDRAIILRFDDALLPEEVDRRRCVLDSGDDLTGIALEAGFASHSHFTARFRNFFGCTPSALRQKKSVGQISQLRKIVTARTSDRD